MKSIYPSFRHFSRTTCKVIMRLLNVLCQSFRHVPRTLWFQYKRFIIAFEVWAWGKFWSPLSMKWSLLLHSSRATLRARVSRDEHAEGETSFYCLSAFSLHWHIDQLNLVFCTRQGRWEKKKIVAFSSCTFSISVLKNTFCWWELELVSLNFHHICRIK